jgi:hypothetical protein
VLAARADGRLSHDVNSSSPGGAIDAPGSAGVGVGAASERDALSAASVGRDCSLSEPTASTGGGDRGQSRRLGAVLAARVDGCSSHDANPSSPDGAIDAPGSAVVGVGAASNGASFAAPVASEDSVGEPPTPVGGGGHDQPHRRGAARAASAGDRSSCDADSSSFGGTPRVSVSAVVGAGAAGTRGAS